MVQLNEITMELENRIAEHKALMDAWSKVEKVTKKDGKEFALLSKNFKNVVVRNKDYSIQSNAKELKVYCYYTRKEKNYECNQFTYDTMDVNEIVRYSSRGKEIDESRIIKEPYIEPYYIKNVSEIWEDIQNEIQYHKDRITSLEEQLKITEEKYNAITDKMNEIQDILNTLGDNADLKYSLENVVKKWYFC